MNIEEFPIARLRMKPGDRLIIKVPPLRLEEVRRMQQDFVRCYQIDPIILPQSFELSVVSREEAERIQSVMDKENG